MGRRTKVLKVYLTEELYQRLKEICERSKVSMSSFVATLISLYLERGMIPTPQTTSFGLTAPQTITFREVVTEREVSIRMKGYGDAKTHAELMSELKEVLQRRRQKLEQELEGSRASPRM